MPVLVGLPQTALQFYVSYVLYRSHEPIAQKKK